MPLYVVPRTRAWLGLPTDAIKPVAATIVASPDPDPAPAIAA